MTFLVFCQNFYEAPDTDLGVKNTKTIIAPDETLIIKIKYSILFVTVQKFSENCGSIVMDLENVLKQSG